MPGKGWYLSVGNAFFSLLHTTGDPASLHWAQQQPGCGYVFLDERQIHPQTLLASIKDRARSLNHGALSRSRLEQLSDLSIKLPTGYSSLSLARLRVGRQSKVIYGWHQPMYLCAHLVYATSFSAQPASISHHFYCEEFPPNNLNLPFFFFFQFKSVIPCPISWQRVFPHLSCRTPSGDGWIPPAWFEILHSFNDVFLFFSQT